MLINKTFASELSRKFIKSALLVGQGRNGGKFWGGNLGSFFLFLLVPVFSSEINGPKIEKKRIFFREAIA